MAGRRYFGADGARRYGAVYRDNGQAGDAIEILRDHGVNWFRLRLFVNPQFENNCNGGYDAVCRQDLAVHDRPGAARQGSRRQSACSTSTTPTPGPTPAIRSSRPLGQRLDFSQLQQQVYDYTKQSIEAFKAAGVLPEMVQIGNEIANGMLWKRMADCMRTGRYPAVDTRASTIWPRC